MIETIRARVAGEFDRVNQLIVDQLYSDVDMVENVGHYIVEAGGKRMRPLLALLATKAVGDCTDRHIRFAAVVEFIHTATLLHDDVVDISALRRGRPTVNATFGNAPSVLVGDFLYTRAFQLMVTLDSMPLLQHMADTTNAIAEGEVLQLVRAGDPDTTVAQYLDVITRKTAVLFAAACRGAAMMSGTSPEREQLLHDFGLNLGIAFQMIDDVLDYEGDPEVTGKAVGDDLNEGKPTLPLIHTMAVGDDTQRRLVATALREKTAAQLPEILAAVRATGGIDATRTMAIEYRDRAMQCLEQLDAGDAAAGLKDLLELSINREA